MNPVATKDTSTLRWVRGELNELVRGARRAVEGYVEGDGDASRLQECRELLHQARGTLRMVEVYGGAMLADEMEQVVAAMAGGRIERTAQAAEGLMTGLVQLPAYLERLEDGDPDIPLIFLPLLNELRKARGEKEISEVALFAPKLRELIDLEPVLPGSGSASVSEEVHKRRTQFQKALLNWYRHPEDVAPLREIRDIIDALNALAGTTRLRKLLDAGEALAVALIEQAQPSENSVRALFGRLDRFLKDVADHGEEAAVKDYPLELLRGFLYHVIRSDSDSPVVAAVREVADTANSFAPDVAADADMSLGGPDRALFEAVSVALRQDLRGIKDELDLYIRGTIDDRERLVGLIEPLRHVGDTLGMIGRGALRERLQARCNQIRTLGAMEAPPEDDALLEIASDVLHIESALAGLDANDEAAMDQENLLGLSESEFRNHANVAINEAIIDLAKVKDAVGEFLDQPDQPTALAAVPEHLHTVAGALRMLEQPAAAEVLDSLSPALRSIAAEQRPAPDAEARDALADVITGIEYFLEAVLEGRGNGDDIIDYARIAGERLQVAIRMSAAEEAAEALTGTEISPVENEALVPVSVDDAPQLGDIDSEIREVFLEEAREELAVIRKQYPVWRDQGRDEAVLQTFRRSFHTLKGSGRLVGATTVGEFAWSIENLLNGVIEGSVVVDTAVISLLDDACGLLPQLIEALSGAPSPAAEAVDSISERAFALVSAEAASENADDATAEEPALDIEELEILVEPAAIELEAAPIELDNALERIFRNEVDSHLASLEQFILRCGGRDAACEYDDELVRVLHTLRGSANMAGVRPVAELAQVYERFVNLKRERAECTDAASVALLQRGAAQLRAIVKTINQPGAVLPDWQALHDEIGELVAELAATPVVTIDVTAEVPRQAGKVEHGRRGAFDAELLEVFLDEARELADRMDSEFTVWQEAGGEPVALTDLQRTLHTLKGSARLSGAAQIGNLSHALESLFGAVQDTRVEVTAQLRSVARRGVDQLANAIERLQADAIEPDTAMMVERIETALHGEFDEPDSVSSELLDLPSEAASQLTDAMESSASVVVDELGDADRPAETPREEPVAAETAQEVQFAADGETALPSDAQFLTDSELLGDSGQLDDAQRLDVSESAEVRPAGVPVEAPDVRVVPFRAQERRPEPASRPLYERRPLPPDDDHDTQKPHRERVRVRADALDDMVNSAGEVSIFRARLDQQNNNLAFNLLELERTTTRLRSQLRQLEIETEAQILSRHEGEHYADFDPLELDRYSTIQELSRALSETVNDLGSIGTTLDELRGNTEAILVQHARVSNELQDDLLRTRMIPFGSRVARLQRVVRQTAQSLGKQADLSVRGAEGELDRSILDRMLAPLEHLLRNAVAHGIEIPEDRLALGKPAVGQISLDVSREGGSVLITVADDGVGLDRASIRRKAIEKGILASTAELADADLDQFILEPGFTTAPEVTQIAGRGVGMDVVLSETKQLGGSLQLASEPGKGVRFTIQLPFTLAITDGLLVQQGEEVYAVPHGSVDGVVRISQQELADYYDGGSEALTFQGDDYVIRYLGTMLSGTPANLIEGQRWYPLLLLKSGDHRVAVHVDALLGNRQIVVKPVGVQLAAMRAFSGATILGDGRVALILDMNGLVRTHTTQQFAPAAEARPEAEQQGITVMVVDDSITVRKVTTRLLERHNMRVVTAKDGVDAIALLQEVHPDVMLLDIEMPRMDGFELARNLQHTSEFNDIPIIMITSRSGKKHRDRAMALGVKRYLGKPYQETDLLDQIYTVLAGGPA